MDIFSSIEVSGMSFTQSIEAPLTLKDTITLYGSMATQNGTGHGTINVSAKKLVSSKGWLELDVGAGNGPTISLKGFRTLTKRLFCDGETILQFTAHGVRPGFVGSMFFNFYNHCLKIQFIKLYKFLNYLKIFYQIFLFTALAMQLDKHTVGYLTYRAGIQSAMSTMLVRDTSRTYASILIHLGIVHSYVNLHYIYKMKEKKLKLRGNIRLVERVIYIFYLLYKT